MGKRERLITKRTNIFDGQRITETDLDTEQIHNNALVSNLVVDFHGSGVVKTSPFEDTVLLDTRSPASTNASKLDIESGLFDGKGIRLDYQPSDPIRGNRLEFELVDVDIKGRNKTKIMVIGRAFDGIDSQGNLVIEFIEFSENTKKVSQYFYVSVIAIMFNNFSGGTGKTEYVSSKDSLDLISANDGYLIVREAGPLSVYVATRTAFQIESPNFDLNNFITSDESKSIEDEIEIVLGSNNNIADIYIELDGKEQLRFEVDGATSISYGQKFLSKTNNIQKIDLLVSVERNEDADADEQFDFSGDLVISIHSLVSETACITDAVPDDLIDFDPEITPLVEISFGQEDLETLGYKLNATPQVVSFNFAGTLIADPNIEPNLEVNKYYAFLVSRRGDNRTGTILIEKGFDKVDKKTDDGTPLTVLETFGKQQSKFLEYDPISKRYVNDSQSSLWHVIHTDAVEITDGTAYTDFGVAVSVQKTESFVGNTEISHFVRNVTLRTVAENASNFLVMSQVEEFSEPSTHPRTNNQVFTRISDAPAFDVVNSDELSELVEDTIPLLLAKINDKNVRDAQTITGAFSLPGLIGTDYITIVDPGANILQANLINRIITPDTDCDCNARYRIARVDCEFMKAGDLNSDGVLNSEDLSLMLNVVGNTINSVVTEKAILGGDLSILDFIKSDLNDDGTVDGIDIELLEGAVDGYVNFSVSEEIRVIFLRLENILEESDYPVVFTDTATTGVTTAASATLNLTVETINQGLIIRAGDIVTIPDSSVDGGEYVISAKSIAADDISVTLTLTNVDGSSPSFVGDSGFNVLITSGTAVNIYADNLELADVPFTDVNFEIAFIEAPFEEKFVEICDLRRDVGVNFIEIDTTDCECVEPECLPTTSCAPVYKNQAYLPGDLFLPNGNILKAPGVPHPGDFEYVNVKLPLPPGTIDDCSLNIYTNFVKAENGSCLTVAGYPAMKYSDGTLVGCEDVGLNTDITKGRVKFDYRISSIFVDSLGNDEDVDEGVGTSTEEDVETISENFRGLDFEDFDSWIESPSNDGAITNIDHANGDPAVFSLQTSSDSGIRFGRLVAPVAVQNFEGDFILDFVAARTTWQNTSITNGTVTAFATAVITNDDNSVATLKLGWGTINGGATKIFYSGVIEDEFAVVLSSFTFSIDAPDNLGEEVAFRLRRVNDVVFAYYIIPDRLSESTIDSFGHYVRIGTNPDMQPGTGTVATAFEISQQSSPTAGAQFFVTLSEFTYKVEYSSDASVTSMTIGRDSGTREIDRANFTIPFNLPRRTSIISATLNFTSETTDTISEDFKITPMRLFNADNLGALFNVPLVNASTTFSPGSIIDGDIISVDITAMYTALSEAVGNLTGFLKGFVIEPEDTNDSSFTISSDIELVVEFEDESTGIVFKVGVSIDLSTGIATFNTKNILYDSLSETNRTVLNFGIYLKKSGFINQDISLSIDDLSRLGVGTCFDEQIFEEDGECFYVSAGGEIVGPFECSDE